MSLTVQTLKLLTPKKATATLAHCGIKLAISKFGDRLMPARSGQQYINNLSNNSAEVWIGGERVKDVTTHPAFQNGVRSLAALYDLQHNPNTKQSMTFKSPSSDDPVGLSFIVPKAVDDL